MRPTRFRYNAAIVVAAAVAFFGALPLAASRWFLAPILLIPLVIGVWGIRAGTDADPAGVRLKALLGSRRLAWSEIAGMAPDERGRVHAALASGVVVRLPAVNEADLPRLIAASGHQTEPAGPAEAPGRSETAELTGAAGPADATGSATKADSDGTGGEQDDKDQTGQ